MDTLTHLYQLVTKPLYLLPKITLIFLLTSLSLPLY
jgi:hypothetical protein